MTVERWRLRIWPRNLASRTILLLLVSLTVFHLGSLWMHQHGLRDVFAELDEARIAERLASAARTIAGLPVDERDHAAHALSDASLGLGWSLRPSVTAAFERDREPEVLARLLPRLAQSEPGFAGGRFAPWGDAGAGMQGSLGLADGTWLNLTLAPSAASPAMLGSADTVASTTVMAVGIVGASILLVRWLTGPLRRLAQTADRMGRGRVVPVPQDGPEEVQRLARALDAMQARITRLLDDRTLALAAVSHDLRTPITRLRLRAGFLEDRDTQALVDSDLDEMEGMISATLAYLQGEAEPEPPHLTDLGALLSTLCDAAADAGQQVSYDGPRHLDLCCRPGALRRALSNIIANAVAYGGSAQVVLAASQDAVRVSVEDPGPGIPEVEMERVFEPFHRLEGSRNRGTGGVGLGLTIARQAVVGHGGTLELSNRPEGGLRAVVCLPRTSPALAEMAGSRPGSFGKPAKGTCHVAT